MGRVTREMVERWQQAGHVHELTCRHDSRHLPLAYAGEEAGAAVLRCPTCDYRQLVLDESPLAALLERGPGPNPLRDDC